VAKALAIIAVGLTRRQISSATPHLAELAERGSAAPMSSVLPALTCSAQATLLTGKLPGEHGVVGNGWMDPHSREVALWRQANGLVQGEKVYETARRRDPNFTCAKLFWWWNMGAAVDWSITPRPHYPADGRKIPAVYGTPPEFPAELERDLGPFPFFDFWGPKAGLPSSQWIASAAQRTLRTQDPDLTLVYLPHLDYSHQRFGPHHATSREALTELDALVGQLVTCAGEAGAQTLVLSEYGIEEVSRPVHINRTLRAAGLLQVRPTPGGEILDPFASQAFALADHQVAHVYCQGKDSIERARAVLQDLEGVEQVLDRAQQDAQGIDHPRSGDLLAVCESGAWFTYYYWTDRASEPDFARTVDIHRKPGYDPCEMFLDPSLPFPRLKVAGYVARKKLGQRGLLKVIPVDAQLVHGSHGRRPEQAEDGPVFLSTMAWSAANPEPVDGSVPITSVRDRILGALGLD
jgi:predicted AlkP superfamily pyrophosphatase or phosphodiesterase